MHMTHEPTLPGMEEHASPLRNLHQAIIDLEGRTGYRLRWDGEGCYWLQPGTGDEIRCTPESQFALDAINTMNVALVSGRVADRPAHGKEITP